MVKNSEKFFELLNWLHIFLMLAVSRSAKGAGSQLGLFSLHCRSCCQGKGATASMLGSAWNNSFAVFGKEALFSPTSMCSMKVGQIKG